MLKSYVKNLSGAALMAIAGAAANAVLVSSASATLWNIDEVLVGDSGFGASLFHDATGSNVMNGNVLANVTGAGNLGTFDDVTGTFSGTFDLTGPSGPSFTLSGTGLIFGAGGFGTLANNSELTVNFDGGPLNGAPSGSVLGFKQGYVCCGNSANDPNSFNSDGMGGGILTLWGADGLNLQTGYYDRYFTHIGLDIRVHLTPSTVPLPAALPLMASALAGMGYLGRRRKKAAVA